MTQQVYVAQYVAAYLGVSSATVNYWVKTSQENFPEPDFEAVAHRDRPVARLWTEDKLPLLRAWYANRNKMSSEEAAAHWVRVDHAIKNRIALPSKKATVHPDQMTIEVTA